MSTDVLILANGPGEVATWVKPVVQALRSRAPDPASLRISVMLSPCPHASGGEADSLRRYPEVNRVQGPEHFFRFLLTGKTAEGWDWRKHGVVVFLGGDQAYVVLAAKRLGYRSVIYAEWDARWLPWVDRVGVMQASLVERVKPRYRAKLTVVGDLMADVPTSSAGQATIREALQLSPETILMGLLPGSKPGKLRPGAPLLLAIANTIHQQRPDLRDRLRFVIPLAPTVTVEQLTQYADARCNPVVSLMQGPTVNPVQPDQGLPYLETAAGARVYLWTPFPAYDLLQQCQLCLTTVGANTAQLGALGVPMIVLLPTQHLDAMRSWEGIWGILGNLPVIGRYLNRLITRVMIQVIRRTGKKFAWPNTWAGREVVPELLGRLSAEGVSDQVLNYLEHPEQLAAMRQQLRLLRGPAGAAERLARLILDTLDFPQNASRPTQPSPDPTHDSTPALP